MRTVVVGVGSPRGDDAAGLAVARALRREPRPRGLHVLALDRAGLDLLEVLRGADVAVVVDALCSGGRPGRLARPTPDELRRAARAPSSHALGVAEALALGEALGVLPAALEIVAVEIGRPPAAGPAGLSPAVAAAIGPACEEVWSILARLGASSSSSVGSRASSTASATTAS